MKITNIYQGNNLELMNEYLYANDIPIINHEGEHVEMVIRQIFETIAYYPAFFQANDIWDYNELENDLLVEKITAIVESEDWSDRTYLKCVTMNLQLESENSKSVINDEVNGWEAKLIDEALASLGKKIYTEENGDTDFVVITNDGGEFKLFINDDEHISSIDFASFRMEAIKTLNVELNDGYDANLLTHAQELERNTDEYLNTFDESSVEFHTIENAESLIGVRRSGNEGEVSFHSITGDILVIGYFSVLESGEIVFRWPTVIGENSIHKFAEYVSDNLNQFEREIYDVWQSLDSDNPPTSNLQQLLVDEVEKVLAVIEASADETEPSDMVVYYFDKNNQLNIEAGNELTEHLFDDIDSVQSEVYDNFELVAENVYAYDTANNILNYIEIVFVEQEPSYSIIQYSWNGTAWQLIGNGFGDWEETINRLGLTNENPYWIPHHFETITTINKVAIEEAYNDNDSNTEANRIFTEWTPSIDYNLFDLDETIFSYDDYMFKIENVEENEYAKISIWHINNEHPIVEYYVSNTDEMSMINWLDKTMIGDKDLEEHYENINHSIIAFWNATGNEPVEKSMQWTAYVEDGYLSVGVRSDGFVANGFEDVEDDGTVGVLYYNINPNSPKKEIGHIGETPELSISLTVEWYNDGNGWYVYDNYNNENNKFYSNNTDSTNVSTDLTSQINLGDSLSTIQDEHNLNFIYSRESEQTWETDEAWDQVNTEIDLNKEAEPLFVWDIQGSISQFGVLIMIKPLGNETYDLNVQQFRWTDDGYWDATSERRVSKVTDDAELEMEIDSLVHNFVIGD